VEDEEEYGNSPAKGNVSPPAQTGSTDFNVQYVAVNYLPENYSPNIAKVISSKNELEQYLNSSRGEHGNMALESAIKKYTDDYFANNYLVIVGIWEGSGSIRHKVESIDENGDIVISRSSPEILTMDIGKWNIIIELSNEVKVEKYKATFVAQSSVEPSIDFNVKYIRHEHYVNYYPPAGIQNPIIKVVSLGEGFTQDSIYEEYPDDFFTNNYLVIVEFVETSGSIRHKVERINENGDIVISCLLPEYGTDDIAAWSIIIELSKDVKIEKFKAVVVDVNL
jgi:hypothetical protein